MINYLLIFSAAFFSAILLTPLAMNLSRRWGILALPGGRRKHAGRIPQLGGIPVVGGFLIGGLLAFLIFRPVGDDATRLTGVLIGTAIIFVGGAIDDRFDLSWGLQLLIQFVGAVIAMGSIVFIEVFTNPLTGELVWLPRFVALAFTAFWIMGMMITVNWTDGLDGLAVGIGTIAAFLFAWHSYNLGQLAVAAFPVALAGALLGFLPFNFSPARIFLGAAGAYGVGYGLATLSILAPAKIATALLVMAVPILDVAWQIFNRVRLGQSPFQGDRGHLHFRLSDGGLPTRRIVLGYYLVVLSFGLVAIFAPGIIKLVMLIGLSLLVILILIWLTRRSQRIQSAPYPD